MAENRSPLSPVHKLLITQVLVVIVLLLSAVAYQGLYQSREQAQQAEIVAVSYTHLTLPTIYSV